MYEQSTTGRGAERILIVEDEAELRTSLAEGLRSHGFETVSAGDGERALELEIDELFDSVVVDINLPGLSGLEVVRRLRSGSPIPILVMTSSASEVSCLLSLELGADDFLRKPFSVDELSARIRAVLRRQQLEQERYSGDLLRVGGVVVDTQRHEVTVDGRHVRLTPTEFKILLVLGREPERIFTRADLVRELWQTDFAGIQRSCDAHVTNLRRKLEPGAASPRRLITVRGAGYMLARS